MPMAPFYALKRCYDPQKLSVWLSSSLYSCCFLLCAGIPSDIVHVAGIQAAPHQRLYRKRMWITRAYERDARGVCALSGVVGFGQQRHQQTRLHAAAGLASASRVNQSTQQRTRAVTPNRQLLTQQL
jgi:hypothetical protein